MNNRFYGALDAADCAAHLCRQWVNEYGEILDIDKIRETMYLADSENPLDQTNPSNFYYVTPQGDIGQTYDGGQQMYWIYRSYRQMKYPSAPVSPTPDRNANRASGATQQQSSASTEFRPPKTSIKPGFSDRIDNPDFIKAIKKNKKTQRGCAWFFIIAPIVIVPVYTAISDDFPLIYGLLFGGAISAFFLIIYSIVAFKDKVQKPWTGTVVKKYRKKERRHERYDNDHDRDYWIDYDYVIIRRDDGKKHKIKEKSEDSLAWSYHYFQEGDCVKFHANKGFAYPYEKYDKSKDTMIICVFCRNMVPIKNSECDHCHQPLLN